MEGISKNASAIEHGLVSHGDQVFQETRPEKTEPQGDELFDRLYQKSYYILYKGNVVGHLYITIVPATDKEQDIQQFRKAYPFNEPVGIATDTDEIIYKVESTPMYWVSSQALQKGDI